MSGFALSKIQSDRRYAEITASYNGLNLKSAYPDLSREELGSIVRAAKQALNESAGSQTSPAAMERGPKLSAVQTTAKSPGPETTARAIELDNGFGPSETDADPPIAGPWEDLTAKPEADDGNRKPMVTVAVVAAAALFGALVAWNQWEADSPPSAAGTLPTAPIPEQTSLADASPEPDVSRDLPVTVIEKPTSAEESALAAVAPAPAAPAKLLTEAPTAASETATNAKQAASEDRPEVDEPRDEERDSVRETAVQTGGPVAAETDLAETSALQPPSRLLPATLQPDLAVTASASMPASDASPEPVTRVQTETIAAVPLARPFNTRVDADLVLNIQKRLSALGFDPGPADGLMGWRTYRAIRGFQESKGLKVDGEATEILLGSLVSYSGSSNR